MLSGSSSEQIPPIPIHILRLWGTQSATQKTLGKDAKCAKATDYLQSSDDLYFWTGAEFGSQAETTWDFEMSLEWLTGHRRNVTREQGKPPGHWVNGAANMVTAWLAEHTAVKMRR